MVIIQTATDPFYEMSVDLDGQEYVLDFRFNVRENVWYMTLCDSSSVALVGGIKIVCNFPLTNRFPQTSIPPGEFFAIPNGQDDSPPGLTELGPDSRVTLVYVELSDYPGV